MKNKLFKHKPTGNIYTCLGTIKHKDETTREWLDHIGYTDNLGTIYSRTPSDFHNNFELAEKLTT